MGAMKRRQFNQMIAAAGAMAALPFGAAARVATPVASRKGYVWAVSRAMSKGSISAEAMVRELGMSPRAARAHLARMIQRGVVTAPNAAGTASVVSPVLQGAARVQVAGAIASQARSANSGAKPARHVVQKLRSALRDEDRPQIIQPEATEPGPKDTEAEAAPNPPAAGSE